jgi:Flp pilus assembly pilin Flp
MMTLERGIRFLRDESGSELAEYALVMTAFTLLSIAAVKLLGTTANARVETDETNYTNSFVNGY